MSASDTVVWNIWLANFFTEQGIKIRKNTLFQDNEYAINIEKKGKMSQEYGLKMFTLGVTFCLGLVVREMP